MYEKVLRDGSILEFMKKNYAFSEETPDGKRDRLTVYELINRRYYTIDQCRDFLTKMITLCNMNVTLIIKFIWIKKELN